MSYKKSPHFHWVITEMVVWIWIDMSFVKSSFYKFVDIRGLISKFKK